MCGSTKSHSTANASVAVCSGGSARAIDKYACGRHACVMRTSPAFTLIAALALALALGGCGSKPNAAGGGLLQVGAVAPDLTGMTAQSAELRLSQVKGHPAVVY